MLLAIFELLLWLGLDAIKHVVAAIIIIIHVIIIIVSVLVLKKVVRLLADIEPRFVVVCSCCAEKVLRVQSLLLGDLELISKDVGVRVVDLVGAMRLRVSMQRHDIFECNESMSDTSSRSVTPTARFFLVPDHHRLLEYA